MNISIDDTSPNFVWSNGANDWRGQAPNQLSINNQYFLQTYHASQSKGANVAITFVGNAIQIYGSKGPNHGNYSVTFDNTIKFFAGFQTQVQYQQLLFSQTFGTNLTQTHTVTLKNEEDYWLDLDFVVLTVSTAADTSTSDIGFFTNTVSPGTSVPPSATDSSSSDGSSSSSSSDGSSAPPIFRVLTFALAGVLALAIVVLLAWYFLSRRARARGRSGGGGGRGGRGRALSNGSSQQEFQYAQKTGRLSHLDTSRTQGGGGGGGGGGKFAGGKEGYASPTSAGGSMDASRYSRHDPLGVLQQQQQQQQVHNHNHTNNNGTNAVVSGAARDTLIALNNMGKRPGYRTLPGDADGSLRLSVVVPSGGGGGGGRDGSETPTSLRTMGSAGQVWLGATKHGPTPDEKDRDGGVRFKGRAAAAAAAGRENNHHLGNRSSSYGSDSNLSSRLDRSRPSGGGGGLEHINDSKDEEDPYAPSGIRRGMYSGNMRTESSEHQRMMELKRSASVASSGILDRLTGSPPPAVPELPPNSATTMTTTTTMATTGSSRMDRVVPPPRSFSPAHTESSTVYEHGGITAGLGLATKIQYPYGRNNEMRVHSHSGSLNSTSGISAITATTAVNNGSIPLRPAPPAPPLPVRGGGGGAGEDKERERAEKEREYQRRNAGSRDSRTPPDYAPTPAASQTSIAMGSTSTVSGAGGLQRQGTRTGDIPIGLEGGVGFGYESDSQDSHSLAHAYVGTAQHVTVSPPTASQLSNSRFQPLQLQSQPPSQQQQRPQHQVQRNGQTGSQGSSNLGLAHSTVTGTSSKRAVTPDRGRSYDPGRAVAVASRARSNTPTSNVAVGAPAWVGRGSEESSKTWGLDGVLGSQVSLGAQGGAGPGSGLGRPIMDDRTRLAIAAAGNVSQAGQRVSRVPPPRE